MITQCTDSRTTAGVLSKTLFRTWIHRSNLKNLREAADGVEDDDKMGFRSLTPPTKITHALYQQWMDCLDDSSPGKWVLDVPDSNISSSAVLQPVVILQSIYKDAQKKNYTMEESHKGNSYIHFRLGDKDLFGSIQRLFTSEQIPAITFFEVALFITPDHTDDQPDPFAAIASLHYHLLVRPNPPQTVVINQQHLVGHVAVLTNPAGVFGFESETISIAIVHHMVSSFLFLATTTCKPIKMYFWMNRASHGNNQWRYVRFAV